MEPASEALAAETAAPVAAAEPAECRGQEPAPAPETAAVNRNSSGGVLVGEREISMAFSFLDAKGKGVVDKASIQERLSLFPGAGEHGLQELRGLDSELTQKSLSKLLKNNKVSDFDPVAEAFQVPGPLCAGPPKPP